MNVSAFHSLATWVSVAILATGAPIQAGFAEPLGAGRAPRAQNGSIPVYLQCSVDPGVSYDCWAIAGGTGPYSATWYNAEDLGGGDGWPYARVYCVDSNAVLVGVNVTDSNGNTGSGGAYLPCYTGP